MGNVQRVLESVFCEAPGCPEDAAPDARYCTRHMRARVVHLDCSYWRCDLRAEPDSIFCEAHGLLEEARSKPPAPAPAPEPQTKEPDVEPVPERPQCRIDECENLAAPWTIGARRQGGRYDLCGEHLEALTEKARETRRRNREAAQGVSAAPIVGEEPGAAGSPAGESNETAPPRRSGAVSPLSEPETLPVIECARVDQHPAHRYEDADHAGDGITAAWCDGLNADGTAPYDPARPGYERWAPGVGALNLIEQEPQPGDVELPLDRVPLARLCGRHSDHDAHEWIEDDDPRIGMETLYRCDGSGEGSDGDEPERAIAVAGIVEEDGRFSFGVPNGPQRPLSWAERAQTLVDVGVEIDELERDLENARARWRSLASPE